MHETQFPFEIISNFFSLLIVGAILYQFFQYKKKMDVIKTLSELKENKELSDDDKRFIESNYNEYGIKHQKQQALIKLVYPLLILITGCLFLLLETASALIHMNIIVVSFLYLHILRIHYRNYFNLLDDLKD